MRAAANVASNAILWDVGMNPELAQAILSSARRLGADPVDLATVVSYETGGKLDPEIWGGAGGKHFGLIQAGPAERERYGIQPGMPVDEHMAGVERYLVDRGFKPGMGLLDLYSTINAGRPGLYNRSDAANGGAPGTVADKVANQMAGHRVKAEKLLALAGSPAAAAPVAAPAAPVAAPVAPVAAPVAPVAPARAPMAAAPAPMGQPVSPIASAMGSLLGDVQIDPSILQALRGISARAQENDLEGEISAPRIEFPAPPGIRRERARIVSKARR